VPRALEVADVLLVHSVPHSLVGSVQEKLANSSLFALPSLTSFQRAKPPGATRHPYDANRSRPGGDFCGPLPLKAKAINFDFV
jgi:hypothetical protein